MKKKIQKKTRVNYLNKNSKYWEKGYHAPNVESFVFRFYGRILVNDFNITGKKKERILDFGCGQGGNLNFFHKLGFDVYGVDIAKKDIHIAKKVIKLKKNNFKIIDTKPNKNLIFFKNKKFDVAISIQTLDFLSNSDFDQAINCIYNNMKKGAVIYVTMNAWCHYYRKKGNYAGDGLWSIKFNNGRVKYDLMLNFIKNKNEMKRKMKLFKPIFIDSYDIQARHEGSEKRYAFVGVKE